jgi:transcriptional regulator with XRE-family HTH domain
MDDITLRKVIAENLVYYRREKGLTQAALAETLNYSDKSVSKWERGEGLPDITVLYRLAEFYEITVNDLVTPPEEREKQMEAQREAADAAEAVLAEESGDASKQQRPLRTRILVPVLSIGLVWLTAMVLFFFQEVLCPGFAYSWLIFLYAIPASFIVATVFACIWWNHIARFVSVSGIVWSVALCLHLSIALPNIWLIYAVAGVLQILTVLWFIQMKK